MLDSTKKGYPASKDKEEFSVRLQEGHSHNKLKLHIHKVDGSKGGKQFKHRSESSEPHIRLPTLDPGVQQRKEESPENLTMKASRV